jgi:hypothetical protein
MSGEVKSNQRTVRNKLWRVVVWRVMAAILLAAMAQPAAAHITGTPHLVNAPAGDYLITVWTAPDPVRTDDFHVIVGVTRPEDPSLVLGETVMVTAAPVDGRRPTVTARATHEQSDNKFLYEAYLAVEEEGLYEVTVVVGAATIGEQSGVTFTVAVAPARWQWQRWLFWGGLLLLAAWLTWRNLPRQWDSTAGRRPKRQQQVAHG